MRAIHLFNVAIYLAQRALLRGEVFLRMLDYRGHQNQRKRHDDEREQRHREADAQHHHQIADDLHEAADELSQRLVHRLLDHIDIVGEAGEHLAV